MRLEPEQLEFLSELAEEAQRAPRDQRTFYLLPHMSGVTLKGPAGHRAAVSTAKEDVEDLSAAGYLRIRGYERHGVIRFTVAPEAYDFLAHTAGHEPMVKVETDITVRFIEGEAFRTSYPAAYKRWREAAFLLWSSDADAELTTIGHKAREAVQEFATTVVEATQDIGHVDPDPAHTVARLRAAIDAHRDRLGEARHDLLGALIVYWGEVSDLLQRQEHGGQKEGEALSWEDGRRAVFQTAVVMYEIDRTLRPVAAAGP